MRWPLRRVEVRGMSMAPTYLPGDWLLATGWKRPRPGDVALLRRPGGGPLIVKRVRARDPGGIWVEGDNPGASTDSRHFGPVPPDEVLGTVLVRYGRRSR